MPSGGSFSLTLILTPGMWKRKWKLEAEVEAGSGSCGSGPFSVEAEARKFYAKKVIGYLT